jgi:deoxyribonuclease IV
MKNLLGTHISIAGGLYKSIERATQLDINCMQIFTKSNRMWKAKPLCPNDISAFKNKLQSSQIKEVIVHAGYLINIASDNNAVEEQSKLALIDELERCEALGIKSLVLHPGNSGKATESAGIKKITTNINLALSKTKTTRILLENMAGQGSSIAHSFENIAKIYDGIEEKNRVGICFDTCHAFAAGYDLKDNYENVWQLFHETIGLDKLIAIHLNDSKKPLGSRIDRHENIGKGYLTEAAFQNIINDARFKNTIKILETPIEIDENDYKKDLATLTSLIT